MINHYLELHEYINKNIYKFPVKEDDIILEGINWLKVAAIGGAIALIAWIISFLFKRKRTENKKLKPIEKQEEELKKNISNCKDKVEELKTELENKEKLSESVNPQELIKLINYIINIIEFSKSNSIKEIEQIKKLEKLSKNFIELNRIITDLNPELKIPKPINSLEQQVNFLKDEIEKNTELKEKYKDKLDQLISLYNDFNTLQSDVIKSLGVKQIPSLFFIFFDDLSKNFSNLIEKSNNYSIDNVDQFYTKKGIQITQFYTNSKICISGTLVILHFINLLMKLKININEIKINSFYNDYINKYAQDKKFIKREIDSTNEKIVEFSINTNSKVNNDDILQKFKELKMFKLMQRYNSLITYSDIFTNYDEFRKASDENELKNIKTILENENYKNYITKNDESNINQELKKLANLYVIESIWQNYENQLSKTLEEKNKIAVTVEKGIQEVIDLSKKEQKPDTDNDVKEIVSTKENKKPTLEEVKKIINENKDKSNEEKFTIYQKLIDRNYGDDEKRFDAKLMKLEEYMKTTFRNYVDKKYPDTNSNSFSRGKELGKFDDFSINDYSIKVIYKKLQNDNHIKTTLINKWFNFTDDFDIRRCFIDRYWRTSENIEYIYDHFKDFIIYMKPENLTDDFYNDIKELFSFLPKLNNNYKLIIPKIGDRFDVGVMFVPNGYQQSGEVKKLCLPGIIGWSNIKKQALVILQ